MANRVIVGARHSEMGMWVSRPGFDVFWAGDPDMLFVASQVKNTKSFQNVHTGTFAVGTGSSVDVYHSYTGIIPSIFVWHDGHIPDYYAPAFGTRAMALIEIQYVGSYITRFLAHSLDDNYRVLTADYVITNQSVY